MSLKLEEFRKRLLQQPGSESADNAPDPVEVEQHSEVATSPAPPLAINGSSVNSEPMAAAVSKVFGPAGMLQSRAEDFIQAIDQIDKLNKSVTRTFGPLRAIYTQLSEVSGTFASLHLFQSQLASLSKQFEPMRLLHDQAAQLSGSIESELAQVVKAFDPVKDLSERVNLLARALKQVSELQVDFADLYTTFLESDHVTVATAAGDDHSAAESALH